jgi:pyrrolidone-carboxylate peptidase
MPRILLTAFEPYLEWPDNSSWLTLIELTRLFDTTGRVVTRRYPVNLEGIIERLSEDLSLGFDYAIHLGQSPGSPVIKLETTGLNALASGCRLLQMDRLLSGQDCRWKRGPNVWSARVFLRRCLTMPAIICAMRRSI